MHAIYWAALMLPWLLVAGLGWLVYQLFGQYGRALLNLDEVRARLTALEESRTIGAQPPAPPAYTALEVGTEAPDFALPDLHGRERTLAEFLGSPFLLTFFSSTCGFCVQMSPRLGELGDEAPRVLVIGTGEPDELRRMVDVHRWKCDVLLASDWTVANDYGATGTPTGYLVDSDGRIASKLLVGADALLDAAAGGEATVSGDGHEGADLSDSLRATIRAQERETLEHARAGGLAVKDLSESRIKRDGLSAGTPAPEFSLPDVRGTQRSLKGFRGKRVLLVFSDVGCGPCQAMAEDLNRLDEQYRGDNLQLVMISRGDPEQNRVKVEEQGFRFPVLLQKSYEVSRDYAMFATPVGYLIDERGKIAKDVAVGPEEILELVP